MMDNSWPRAYHKSSCRKGALLSDGTFGHHQTLPSPVTGQRRQLGSRRRLPNGRRDDLSLLRQTVDLVRRFPLDERLDWACHSSRRHTLLLLFLYLRNGLLTDVSPPLAVFHFYNKENCKKKLDKLQEKLKE